MIRLNERLSEFSYGYGVTREVEAGLASIGLRAVPFLPSLVHEEEVGFDVAFNMPGRAIFLQFKLGEELRRFHRAHPFQPIPLLYRPFWRYRVDTSDHQFQRLFEFEQNGAEVYYVSPKFSDWAEYEYLFYTDGILRHSLLMRPSQIIEDQIPGEPVHRILYDSDHQYVCSEPRAVNVDEPREILNKIKARVSDSETPFEIEIDRLYERKQTAEPSYRSRRLGRLSPQRQEDFFKRSKSRTEAKAAIIGIEAWAIGAQLIFVTNN